MESYENYRSISIDSLSAGHTETPIEGFYLSSRIQRHDFAADGKPFLFDGFVLLLCLSGSGSVKINGKNHSVAAPSIVLLPPQQLCTEPNFSDDLDCRTIILSHNLILEFPSPVDIDILNMARRVPVIPLSAGKMQHLADYCNTLEQEYAETDNLYREQITKTLLFALLMEICNIYTKAAKQSVGDSRKMRPEQLSDDFFLLLAENYREQHGVGYYAARMNRTPKYLSTAINRITGRSALSWIHETLLLEAKRLLKITDRTIWEISEDLNFSSPSVFVQFFKHYTGCTPLHFRHSAD